MAKVSSDTFRMPEVSVISSWAVRTRHDEPINRLETNRDALVNQLDTLPIPGIDNALSEEIELIDLYLLDYHEIPFYAGIAGLAQDWNAWKDADELRPDKEAPSSGKYATPVEFLASLVPDQLNLIADFLQRRLVNKYKGRGIGRRPRITNLATYFPYISLPADFGEDAEELRKNTVRALRAALYLAHRLGAHCVEAVCGTWVALPRSTVTQTPKQCRELRQEALINSLQEIFADNPFRLDDPVPVPVSALGSKRPYLALEIEPGVQYLLSCAKEFADIHYKLKGTGPAASRVGINVDLAHFFLTGIYDPASFKEFYPSIFHAHISDHAGDERVGGIHASDLVPGTFHGYSTYEPWLKVLCNKKKTPNFSGVIAVEQEASFQIEDVIAARSIVQGWLNRCSTSTPPATDAPGPASHSAVEWAADWPHEGAFLVIDIGNSTKEFMGKVSEKEAKAGGTQEASLPSIREASKNKTHKNKGADQDNKNDEEARTLSVVIEALCREVRAKGGSALSFTGDGLIVLFEDRLMPGKAARIADEFAQAAFGIVTGENDERVKTQVKTKALTLRCGLHWGTCYIPTEGPLRDNGIGRDIVYAVRLCSWLGDTIERAAPRRELDNQLPNQKCQIGATDDFVKQHTKHFLQYTASPQNAKRSKEVQEKYWRFWGEPTFKGLPPKTVYLRKTSQDIDEA